MGKGDQGIYKLIKSQGPRELSAGWLIDTKTLHFTEDYELFDTRPPTRLFCFS